MAVKAWPGGLGDRSWELSQFSNPAQLGSRKLQTFTSGHALSVAFPSTGGYLGGVISTCLPFRCLHILGGKNAQNEKSPKIPKVGEGLSTLTVAPKSTYSGELVFLGIHDGLARNPYSHHPGLVTAPKPLFLESKKYPLFSGYF